MKLKKLNSYIDFKKESKNTTWKFSKEEFEELGCVYVLSENKRKSIVIPDKGIIANSKNQLIDFTELYKNNLKNYRGEINSDSMEFIYKKIEENSVDYKEVLEDSFTIVQDSFITADINFIVPVRGRVEFAEHMHKSFKEAARLTDLNIVYTVVEHSNAPEHMKFCNKNNLNYIWIDSKDEPFNKCLAHNVGVISSNYSKYYIFHDLDCLIEFNFFIDLYNNISNKDCRAIQCFSDRRVMYLNEDATKRLMREYRGIESLGEEDFTEGNPGAPGGSVLVSRDLFFKVGGYDPELFSMNSPEDAFFWDKIDVIDKMHTSDDPKMNVYHMHHEPTSDKNPFMYEMRGLYERFKNLSESQKEEIIAYKSKLIENYN